jgi:nuclear pore complex protein Nup133
MPQDEMEVLERDYRLERNKLEDLDLDDVYHRVRELAMHDVMWRNA